jgi:hypothetical protein
MKSNVCSDVLLRFLQATPEQRADIERILGVAGGEGPAAGPRFMLRQAGSHWRVVFDGGAEFYLRDTLGVRYLDYLLHRPNQAISAFDLEVAMEPGKAGARARGSIQRKVDGETVRSYLRELTRLRSEREEAGESGNWAESERLDVEIAAMEEALCAKGVMGDAGERARVNVSKAVNRVRQVLAGGRELERAFARHIGQFVSLGYKCVYQQPGGRAWD